MNLFTNISESYFYSEMLFQLLFKAECTQSDMIIGTSKFSQPNDIKAIFQKGGSTGTIQ